MDFEKYKNNDKFPVRPDTLDQKPAPLDIMDFKGKSKAVFEKAEKAYTDELLKYFEAQAKYDKAVKAWHAKCRRLEREFKYDLLEELGLSDNPRADLLYMKAWDYGHSAGLEEVYSYAADLANLIK